MAFNKESIGFNKAVSRSGSSQINATSASELNKRNLSLDLGSEPSTWISCRLDRLMAGFDFEFELF